MVPDEPPVTERQARYLEFLIADRLPLIGDRDAAVAEAWQAALEHELAALERQVESCRGAISSPPTWSELDMLTASTVIQGLQLMPKARMTLSDFER